MHEIKCPHCGKAFKIDEAGYAAILKQVRDGTFEQELHERLELAAKEKQSELELLRERRRPTPPAGGGGQGRRDPGAAGQAAGG